MCDTTCTSGACTSNSEESLQSDEESEFHGSEKQADFSSTDEDDNEEIWNDVLPEDVQRDLNGDPSPLPEPVTKSNRVVHALVFWFVYFLLVWQLSYHISENGMAWLLRFLQAWLKLLGLQIQNDTLAQIIAVFPGSMYMLRQFLDFDKDNFDKFVVCPKCHKLYSYNECIITVNNRLVGKTCSGFNYSRGKKVTCNAAIVYKTQLKNGKSYFYPIKYYCYNSIVNSMERLLKKEDFAEKCEKWKSRSMEDDKMADVYDGKLRNKCLTVNGKDFFFMEPS